MAPTRSAPIASALLALLSACTSPEVFVTVTATDGADLAPTAFRVEVYGPSDFGPATRVRRDVAGQLPQTLLVQLEDGSERRNVRIRVVALEGESPVAAGDSVVRFGEGREPLGIELRPGCEAVACPGLERCWPIGAGAGGELGCDATCTTVGTCDVLGLCADGAKCEIAPGASTGVCVPILPKEDPGAEGDMDTHPGRTCPFVDPMVMRPPGNDCDDSDCAVPAPSGIPPCDGHRDSDCNGVVDEREDCALPCPSMEMTGAPISIPLDGPVVALAGIRELRTNTQVGTECLSNGDEQNAVLFATEGRVHLDQFRPGGGEGVISPPIPLNGIRDVTWSGRLVAIATEDGLVLGRVGPDGLTLRTPPYDAGGALRDLTAVAISRDRVWVSGGDYDLVEIDVERVDALRWRSQNARALGDPDVDVLVAGNERVCGLRRANGVITCWDPTGMTPPVTIRAPDARHIELRRDALVVAVGGATPSLAVYSLESDPPPSFRVAVASRIRGLALLGDRLVRVSAEGIRYSGFADEAALMGGEVFALREPLEGEVELTASVAGGVTYLTVAHEGRLDVVARRCP